MDGRWQLGRVDDNTITHAVPYDSDTRGWPPLSAKRRGGHPASIRSKLARKIAKSSSPMQKPLELVQQLWILEPEALKATSGTPDQVRALIASLAQKHKMEFVANEWRVGGRAS